MTLHRPMLLALLLALVPAVATAQKTTYDFDKTAPFGMALFYDAGKVTSRREDLDFDNLKADFGVGVRFHSPTATPLRIDVAHGSEGLNIVFSGSAAF